MCLPIAFLPMLPAITTCGKAPLGVGRARCNWHGAEAQQAQPALVLVLVLVLVTSSSSTNTSSSSSSTITTTTTHTTTTTTTTITTTTITTTTTTTTAALASLPPGWGSHRCRGAADTTGGAGANTCGAPCDRIRRLRIGLPPSVLWARVLLPMGWISHYLGGFLVCRFASGRIGVLNANIREILGKRCWREARADSDLSEQFLK